MALALRAAGIGLACAAAALLIRKNNAETALLIAAAGAAVLLTLALDSALGVKDFLAELAQAAELSPALVAPVVKTVGIGLITRAASDVSRDAGQSTVSSAIETAGTAAAVCAALPLMKTVFGMIGGLL